MVKAESHPKILFTAVSISAVAVGVAGCGESEVKILNTERVERSIEQSAKNQRKINARVSCPSGVEQARGKTFTCTATFKKGRQEFIVNQVDDRGTTRFYAP